MYDILEKHCQKCDYTPTKKGLVRLLSGKQETLNLSELSAIRTLLSVCAINKIASVLNDPAEKAMLANSVKLLQNLSDPDFDDILPLVWQCEEELAKFEEGYSSFDDQTKASYRREIADYAKKHHLSEPNALKALIKEAKKISRPLGDILFKPKKSYAILWFGIFSLIFFLLLLLSTVKLGWITLLLLVPFGLTAVSISDQLVSLKAKPYFAPRLKLNKIPDEGKTLVTVAALMNGTKGDEKLFEALSRFRYMNPHKNIYFCLLADLPDSKTQFHLEDKKIIQNAREQIDRLNQIHGDCFCLFFRERSVNKSEEKFGGWERKRGAVCELVTHIVKGNKTEYYGGDFIREIKYILTLDSDTNLSVESVKELLSVALHPANRPKVKKGGVVSGYGIIQPIVRTELESAYSSGFSRLISGSGGTDPYANAFFQRSQSLYGSGNFCGKGLINVELFYDLVCDKLPEGLVLSHDVIEGSILRTLCVSDILLTDSTPSNTVSFFRRLHRWIRGDFQNLWFLRSKLLSRFSKFRLLGTVLRHSSSVFSLFAILIGCFIKETSGFWIFVLAYSEFMFPVIFSLIRFLFSGVPFGAVRFFSKAYSMVTQTLVRLFFELSSACRRAVLTLHAFFLSSVRMITRKKTLEWTTAATTEKLSSSLGKFVLDSIISAVLGLGIMIFAKPPFVRLAGLLYFVYPLVSAVMSRKLEDSMESISRLNEKQKKMLSVHASDMVDFYLENVNEKTNHLPPDNIQFSPVSSVAMRTSPTNIGFYLVSLLAARDLNKITSSWLYNRLEKTFESIEKMEKYKGNLYNWYELENLSVIGERYISSVDCGNFIVMLVALKEGLKEYYSEEPRLAYIHDKCVELIDNCDLKCFYDSRRELFKIGITEKVEKEKSNCYDLLMSEARMTGYFAVASSLVSKKHWSSLGRTLTHKFGYIGMKSWSGTAFEYLMPHLFLPLYKNSFMFESVAFSLMMQRFENSIWGVSESGFYSFDSEMNYQYKANGIQALALRRVSADEKIISPYSTYLSLCVLGSPAIRNLNALENLGMYGKYGLYEAIDLNGDSGGICVKSYMAHHVGMSIIACMNAINGNSFVRRFMSDPKMSAARELLQEKIPIDAHIFEDDNEEYGNIKNNMPSPRGETTKTSLASPSVKLLSRGDMSALISSSGHIAISNGNRMISNTEFDQGKMRFSPIVIFSKEKRNYSCVPLCGGDGNFGFELGNGNASHIFSGKDFSGRVKYSFSKSSNCFIINTRAEALRKYDITFAFEPVLDTKKKFLSHISFSRLFIESEYDKSKRILYFHRRSGLDGSHVFTVAVAPRDKNMEFDFSTSREALPASSVNSLLEYGSVETDNKTLECIDPLCLVRANNCDGGKAVFLVSCGETKQECENSIRMARRDKREYVPSKPDGISQFILSSVLYQCKPHKVNEFSKFQIGDLWSKRISGDHPIVTVEIGNIAINRTKEVLNTFLSLTEANIRTELVFIVNEQENYYRPVENSIKETCDEMEASRYFDKNGGIFILRRNMLEDSFIENLKGFSKCCIDFSSDEDEYYREIDLMDEIIHPASSVPILSNEGSASSSNGCFIKEGFVVDKSKPLLAPYSYILTGKRFSSVVTQSSLGYTFFDNARERRLCSFYGDLRTLDKGERIFAVFENRKYDLCAVATKVKYEKGSAVYCGDIGGASYTVTVTVPPEYPVKLIRVQYQKGASFQTVFQFSPVMGDNVQPVNGIQVRDFENAKNKGVLFRNSFSMTFPEGVGFGGVCNGEIDSSSFSLSSNSDEALFFLGACMSESGAMKVSKKIDKSFFEVSLNDANEFALSFVPKIQIQTKSKTTSALMNYFLPYQVSACRFFARGSFYQSGGAYGFRDQLQDCLSVVYSNPSLVRAHIIRCCAHQYAEGSVMHWWHTRHFNGVNRGIKSKCSDDMLYLPLVVSDYLEKTGDYSVLDVKTHYLVSPPLDNENERYEQPKLSDYKESVYHHCLRALSYADKRGGHGLLLMGSCDWNDAFSLVGAKGIGESIFTTLLFIITAQGFLPVIEKMGDYETASHYKSVIEELKNTVEEKAFFGDRYARAICDDGTVLGVEHAEECKIDILSQAFAALAGLNPERVKTALNTAFSKLYDGENKIFKLFSPPFAQGKAPVGYIRGYISGVRENGGQYTHGALWGALGCISAGMNEEALLILDCANPASRCNDKLLAKKYKNEPYAVSADIYSSGREGRGGWSWYTGAASWLYKIMLENVLGIRLGAEQTLISASPIISFEADIEWGNAKLHITASDKISDPLLNGEKVVFPLKLPDGDSTISLPVK